MARQIFLKRCAWAKPANPLYIAYHDEEWGVPNHRDQVHFEFVVLESAQAGLSWETVLKKRQAYAQAFADFDATEVARFGKRRISQLIRNSGIIRNRQKIEAAVNNAKIFLAIQEEQGSFDNYLWQFVGGKPKQNHWRSGRQLPATTKESDALSKDLKKRGFSFFGSTITYAHMQATGLVNDHVVECFRYPECAKLANSH